MSTETIEKSKQFIMSNKGAYTGVGCTLTGAGGIATAATAANVNSAQAIIGGTSSLCLPLGLSILAIKFGLWYCSGNPKNENSEITENPDNYGSTANPFEAHKNY